MVNILIENRMLILNKEEAEPEQEKAKEMENIVKGVYPSPYELSFDNSQFITHMKTGNIDLDSKQDVDTKQAD